MLQCGICKERFSSNDTLRVHLEGHASQLFDSDEELEENEIKSERDSDESLIFEYVKEEEQLQDQRGAQGEGSKELTTFAPSEAVEERRTPLVNSSNNDLSEHLEGHASASQAFDGGDEFQEKEIKTERDLDQDSDEGSLVFDYAKEDEQLHGQDQQDETQGEENSEEFTSVAPSEAADENRTLRERELSSKTLNCSKCSYKTKSKVWFKRHMNIMHLNKHKCDHCPKRYPSKGFLANHIRKEHMKDEDKPILPEDEFFRIKEKQGKRKKKLYECVKCTFKTDYMSHIYPHIRGVHKNLLDELYKAKGMVMDDAAYHKCTKCFYKTLNMADLKRHITIVHQERRDFVCDLCKKAFSTKQWLLNHMKCTHISAEPSELHKCSICTYKTINKSNLKKHLNMVHLKIRNFACDLCQKHFSMKGELRRHIEKHHLEENTLSCNRGSNCSFKTTGKHELSRHIQRVHQKIQGFCCKVCGKWYSSRTGLWSHKQNHTKEEKRLTCDLCQTTTKNRQIMLKHMKRMHLKE